MQTSPNPPFVTPTAVCLAGRRRAWRRGRVGERGLDGGDVPQVLAREGLLHADPDEVGRRAHDHLLQVLQHAVQPQVEGVEERDFKR